MPVLDLTGSAVPQRNQTAQARWTAAEVDTRMVEQTRDYVVDDPIKQGADTPARPATMPIIYFLAKEWITRGVDRWHGKLIWNPPGQWIQQSWGVQMPWNERSNVKRPAPIAYGSLFELQPSGEYSLPIGYSQLPGYF